MKFIRKCLCGVTGVNRFYRFIGNEEIDNLFPGVKEFLLNQ